MEMVWNELPDIIPRVETDEFLKSCPTTSTESLSS